MHTNAAIGFYRCPVCGKRHGDMLLVHGNALFSDTGQEFLGWALCERDEQMHLQGFVALVEVAEAPEGATPQDQLEAAERMGDVIHVHRDRYPLLLQAMPPDFYMEFVTPELAADVRESARLSLH